MWTIYIFSFETDLEISFEGSFEELLNKAIEFKKEYPRQNLDFVFEKKNNQTRGDL
jgi:hypothetical protein